MAQINEISSLRMQDPAVAHATRPRRFKYVNPSFYLFALCWLDMALSFSSRLHLPMPTIASPRQLSGVAVGMVLFGTHHTHGYHAPFWLYHVVPDHQCRFAPFASFARHWRGS